MKQLILIAALLASSSSWGEDCISGNCINGIGTYIYANGDKYVGEWKDDKKHGQGTYTWINGAIYVGEWKDDEQHGQGTNTKADGNIMEGMWENGRYYGFTAEWHRRKAKEAERKANEEAKQKYDRIYNACLLDKSSDVDIQVSALRIALEETCEAIAEDPSWYENWKYN